MVETLTNIYWKLFIKEYISLLNIWIKGKKVEGNVKINNMRLLWHYGSITHRKSIDLWLE